MIDLSCLQGTSIDQLRLAEQKLKDIVFSKLDQAIKNNNEEEIIRYGCNMNESNDRPFVGMNRY